MHLFRLPASDETVIDRWVAEAEGRSLIDEMFEQRTISGSPETVIRKIRAYADVADISLLNCVFHGGDMPAEVARHSMRLFAQEVMPHFR